MTINQKESFLRCSPVAISEKTSLYKRMKRDVTQKPTVEVQAAREATLNVSNELT